MRKFTSKVRLEKIKKAVYARQHDLMVVVENVHDRHNVSAIYRSCDAVGASRVSLLYYIEKMPKLSKVVSSSATKWVETERFTEIDECYESLRKEGFKIYASMLDENAKPLYDLDLTEKVALVMGNEHRGVSEEAAKKADATYYIPMMGMIQSLNVSVANAVSLYEAYRQRKNKGMYEDNGLTEEENETVVDNWCEKKK
ncbi:MAG: tRNA (guanosine(18)-2'-O)-methyltransferase [Melioribacteraceae bacterium]|nr:MAG: tRNA (guanosine(18)-2'-O)-methyltransferase [Melioribacteraceae bacterium]